MLNFNPLTEVNHCLLIENFFHKRNHVFHRLINPRME